MTFIRLAIFLINGTIMVDQYINQCLRLHGKSVFNLLVVINRFFYFYGPWKITKQ